MSMPEVCERVRSLLQFVTVHLIKNPAQAQLRVASTGPHSWRFRLILTQPDVAMMIGRNGMTASALRSLCKAATEGSEERIKIEILSHEEVAALEA